MASSLSRSARPAPRDKARFAKRARDFANRVSALPGVPILPAAGLGAAILLTLVGAFGTAAIPLPARAGFWLALVGWNVVKWQGWFAWRVRSAADWTRAALLGVIPLNAPLPLEIALMLRAVGVAARPMPPRVWAEALSASGVLFALTLFVKRQLRRGGPIPTVPVALPPPDGLLRRAGLNAPAQLLAIEAEDHYCRLHLATGRSLLLLGRFGDAMVEVAALDGVRVHRGAWVAGHAVAGAHREGRRWLLELVGGQRIAVSNGHAAAARARGWLRRSPVALTPLPR